MKPIQKILLLNFFLFSTLLFSQNQRFIYDYKFVLDSTKQEKAETEKMYLDVAAKGSKYYSRVIFVSDSIINEALEKQNTSHSNNFKFPEIANPGKIRTIIEKSYPNYDVLYFNTVDSEDFKVSDGRKINWTISPEKDKIGIWDVQKATCKMFGRNWTAWFTTDIPIQDGPYKFHGLPGLIVKISDQSNSHVIELKGVKNLSSTEEWISTTKKSRYEPLISIDEKKYKKVLKDYYKDPMKNLKLKLAGGSYRMEEIDENGNVMSQSDMIRSREKQAKEALAKFNNILELDLLK